MLKRKGIHKTNRMFGDSPQGETIAYDVGGRKISHSDSNSGTTTYTYNVAGELLTQTDARGIVIRYETDDLGRVVKVTPGSENPIIYEYDRGNSIATSNVLGRLSKVTDSTGSSEYSYDRKGNLLVEKRIIDDLQVMFQRTYDDFDRVKTIKYPEGTLIRNHYTGTGQLGFLTIDSHDGNSVNHTLVSYEGPKLENNKYYIERKTGNGVLTKIAYDPIRKRPLSYVTYLKDSSVEQSITYGYDKKGNIASINDLMNESRNQSFEYDHLSRITKAIGKYGEENYSYHRNGNLLQKGAFAYSYDNSNHIHAVTKVNSPNTGILSYAYDSVGNMTTRNGDAYHYNAQGKLKEIVTSGGDRFEYSYDHSGNRIKKTLQNLNTTTYSFGSLYEVYRAPGKPEKHTMFVLGVEGDIVAQYSRGDASLVTSMASNDWLVNPFCKDVTIDCGTYWKNRIGLNFITFLAETNVYIDGKFKEGHRAIPWILILGTLFVIVHITRNSTNDVKSEFGSETQNTFGISIIPNIGNYIHKQLPRYATSALLVVFTFTSTAGCFPLLMGAGEGESGTPVWLLGIGNGIPANTPSVSNESSSGGGGGGGSASSGSTRITGMFFYHPDHLGSITMITDGNGNVLAGGERGGKSHITYKPYGEILRTDSYGPDITKFKYTGQEEDRESGLYYYKARYYDASLGRFISNDGMVFPGKAQGMNRMMYVEGNPVAWVDTSGNSTNYSHMFKEMLKHTFNGGAAIMRGISGGVKWASGGLSRAADTFDKFANKKSSYMRSDFAKAQTSVFGKKQGEANNKYWDNVLNKSWNKWGINEFSEMANAWGGSFAMVKLGKMTWDFKMTESQRAMMGPIDSFLNFPRIGYVMGGTNNFQSGKWNERGARRGAVKAGCGAINIGMSATVFSPIAISFGARIASFLFGLNGTSSEATGSPSCTSLLNRD
jgi:RHS repeat-associated protein